MFEIGFFNIDYIGVRCACQPKNCQYIPTQMTLLFKLPPLLHINSCKKSVQRTREYINHRLRFFNGTEDLLDMFEIGTFNIVYIGAREKGPNMETRPQKLRTPECNASESESQEGQGQKQPYKVKSIIHRQPNHCHSVSGVQIRYAIFAIPPSSDYNNTPPELCGKFT